MDSFPNRIRKAWNVFRGQDLSQHFYGISGGSRLDRSSVNLSNTMSIIGPIYTRISIDSAAIGSKHVKFDENGRFLHEMDSYLNSCLTLEANIDQPARAFMQDVVMSLCDEGVVAIVPVDTTTNPLETGSFDILTLRTGRIKEWFPEHVRVNLYNQAKGQREDIILAKRTVAIVENPLYYVMNEPNSTLRRLVDKLNLLDTIDRQSGSGKLDLIIQLPYPIKNAAQQERALARKEALESQLQDSRYGIAYTDATEKITQLNRPANNNLLEQVELLTSMLYSQLGLTPKVFEGTADEAGMINYYNRTIEPIMGAINESMRRVFLTKTARTQGQTISSIRNPFLWTPTSQMADLADKFTRNEILSSNEVRAIIGFKPSIDPSAEELRNKNLNQKNEEE